MLVLGQVVVAANAEVGGGGLVDHTRDVVLAVGTAHTYLNSGKILVEQVQAKGSLKLAIVAHGILHDAHQVGRHGKAIEEGCRVGCHLLGDGLLLLGMHRKYSQTNRET